MGRYHAGGSGLDIGVCSCSWLKQTPDSEEEEEEEGLEEEEEEEEDQDEEVSMLFTFEELCDESLLSERFIEAANHVKSVSKDLDDGEHSAAKYSIMFIRADFAKNVHLDPDVLLPIAEDIGRPNVCQFLRDHFHVENKKRYRWEYPANRERKPSSLVVIKAPETAELDVLLNVSVDDANAYDEVGVYIGNKVSGVQLKIAQFPVQEVRSKEISYHFPAMQWEGDRCMFLRFKGTSPDGPIDSGFVNFVYASDEEMMMGEIAHDRWEKLQEEDSTESLTEEEATEEATEEDPEEAPDEEDSFLWKVLPLLFFT